jgi:exonuclease SbcC
VRLVSLRIREWGPYEDVALEFPDGLIGVKGPNGAGKTTIVEAIGWALFGSRKAVRSKMADLRRQGASKGARSSVELVFTLGDASYRVERIPGGTARLWINDTLETEGASATSERIIRELELTWDVYERSVYARQKDVAALVEGNAKARRQHVERLLGLERFNVAAEQARAAANDLRRQLDALVAVAPDEEDLEVALAEAERAAASADPAVGAARERRDGASAEREAANAARDAAATRAALAATLVEQQRGARENVDGARRRVEQREREASARAADEERLASLNGDSDGAATAESEARLWQRLAECAGALEELGDVAPANGDVDALRAQRDSVAAERDALLVSDADRRRRVELLEARVSALAEASAHEEPPVVRERLAAVRAERDGVAARRAALSHALEEDRAHVATVEEAGPDTPCPVCRKPFGDDHVAILAGYHERIERGGAELGDLERTEHELRERVAQLAEVLAASERAATRLEATEGPLSLPAAREALAAAREEALAAEADLARLSSELDALRPALVSAQERARDREIAESRRAERQARFAEAAVPLGVDRYDAAVHRAADDRAVRLAGVRDEVTSLQARLEASAGVATALAAEREVLAGCEARAAELTAQSADLAWDPSESQTASQRFQVAQAAYDSAVEDLAAAEVAARSGDARVGELREKLEHARGFHADLRARRVLVRQHQVAADLLDGYRAEQAARAWPRLEDEASRLLSAATDGRYSEVRLTSDYRLEVADRGVSHGVGRYSGGEQDLAHLCLRLAIADWVSRERGVEIGFVVLDEVFGSQDSERRERLLGQLREVAVRYRQVLVVTHVDDVAEVCDAQVVVSSVEEGRSIAEIVSA